VILLTDKPSNCQTNLTNLMVLDAVLSGKNHRRCYWRVIRSRRTSAA